VQLEGERKEQDRVIQVRRGGPVVHVRARCWLAPCPTDGPTYRWASFLAGPMPGRLPAPVAVAPSHASTLSCNFEV
jgi:hypothetical protein